MKYVVSCSLDFLKINKYSQSQYITKLLNLELLINKHFLGQVRYEWQQTKTK